MADSHATMQGWIKQLKRLEQTTERAAPGVAKALKDELVASAGRQQGPNGRSWTAGQEGKPVLQNVQKALNVRNSGDTVIATLTGHYARHHLGAIRGKIQRKILPTRNLPDPVSKAIERVLTQDFNRVMR